MIIKSDNGIFCDNSLECEAGYFFVKTAQNANFVQDALAKKARVVNIEECKKLLGIDEKIKLIGITGTNGKTSTAAAIYSVLLKLGFKVGLCGTRGAFINQKQVDEKGLTTSPILKTLSYLKLASEEKCDFFVMEVSSHALVQERIQGLNFSAKIFTNLTQDHLDFHQNLKNYKVAKESFFQDEVLKIINKDVSGFKCNEANLISYGIENQADYKVVQYELKDGINAKIAFYDKEFKLYSPLIGRFNLYNLLAAFACVNELVKPDLDKLQEAFSCFSGVEGRVQNVAKEVIVDFAHTPDGIEKVLQALCYQPLIVVFGAGGNRDKTKRPLMAKAAQKYATTLIITSDNPRDEIPSEIIDDIAKGLQTWDNVFIEEDRKKAIQKALSLKKEGDFVVILGKGDETYQEIKGVKYAFSDKLVVQEFLKESKK